MVEHSLRKRKVEGSIPFRGFFCFFVLIFHTCFVMHNDNARPQIHYFPLAMSAFATSPVASPAVDGMVAADEADEEELALRRLVTPARIEARLRRVMGPDCDISGTDSGDKIYTSIRDLWDKEFQVRSERRTDWYQKGYDYWESEENCPISDDGVLGGFGRLTAVDTRDSNAFLDSVASGPRLGLRLDRAADCGAGIGRVSKNLLLPRCGHVDLVEQSPRLLQASAGYIGVDAVRTTLVNAGLQVVLCYIY